MPNPATASTPEERTVPGWSRPDPTTIPDLAGMDTFYGVHLSYFDDGDVILLGHPGRARAIAALRRLLRRDVGADEANDRLRYLRPEFRFDPLVYTYAVDLRDAGCDCDPSCGGDCGLAREIRLHDWYLETGADPDRPGAFPAVHWNQ